LAGKHRTGFLASVWMTRGRFVEQMLMLRSSFLRPNIQIPAIWIWSHCCATKIRLDCLTNPHLLSLYQMLNKSRTSLAYLW
jgi:hypothetical protein